MKILVLAGGFDQIALINELKRRGHYVILADYFENPPAKKYADEHHVVSTLDVDKIYELATEQKVELITTACTDQALLTVAHVSEKLNLPTYIDYSTALNVTNKLHMKKKFKENGIPSSHYKIINHISDIEDETFQFPLVVKPVDCNSSKGVKKIEEINKLNIFVEQAIKMSRTNNAIIEEFKEGIEISIDAFIKDGVSKVLSVTKTSKLDNGDNFTIYKSEYPCELAEQKKKEIEKIVSDITSAFQLNNCPLLVQAIINEKEINVLEFSARMGGGTKYRLINEIAGIDIMKIYVDLILGEEINFDIINTKDKIKLNYVYCKNGILEEFVGFKEAKQKYIIEDYFEYKTKGMEITKRETSSDRAIGYLIKGTQEEIENKEKILNNMLKIIDKEGKNIMEYYY